jgi:PadR family transcriptional regulator, regulatory protein PadR
MAGGNTNFLSGVPELMVLRLLQDREMYGYEIVQAIQVQSNGTLSFGEGVVYPVLHGLEKDGALKSRRREVGGRSRVYYSLNSRGVRRLSDQTDTWNSTTQAIQSVLKGGLHVRTI